MREQAPRPSAYSTPPHLRPAELGTGYEEHTRHRYAWMYQLTHLTRDKDSLHHDDRVDGLAGAVGAFADVLGVDPQLMAARNSQERYDEEWEKLFGEDDGEDGLGLPKFGGGNKRAEGLKAQRR